MSARSFCMVTTFYPPHHFGGDAVYVHRLSNALARRGHRVTVVHCADAYSTLGGETRTGSFENHPNVTVQSLRNRLGPLSPVVTYLTGKPGLKDPALRRIFREHFDVVHFHNVSLVGGPSVLRYGDGIKLYTMHEHWLICPTHVLWKNNRRLCESPECIKCQIAYRRVPQPWRVTGLLDRELHHIDAFLSPSRFTADFHHTRGFGPPIRHLPLFLPDDALQSAATVATAPDRPYFLYVGRLERIKGVHTLIEHFDSYQDADLVIAGDGAESEALRRQAVALPHVRFLGNVDTAALGSLYAGALAVVVPSLVYEVFPLVSLEALSQGTPVVARNVGGLPEAIEDSGGGFVYRSDDELRTALETLKADPALRKRLGELGRSAFRRLWSEESHLDAYFAVIDDIESHKAAA